MIGLLCSVPREANRLLVSITAVEAVPTGSKTLFRGDIAGRDIALCTGGLGKANAAHAAALLITKFNPEALLIFGVGGAYPASGAKVGDIALATEEIFGDEGVLTPEGFRDTEYIGIPLAKTDTETFYNRIPAPEILLTMAKRMLPGSKVSGGIQAGRFVTLSTSTGTTARARELEGRYHPLCENMEGAAAALAATLHGIPWLEVRGISNVVEDRDLGAWDLPRAAEAAQQAVRMILEHWEK